MGIALTGISNGVTYGARSPLWATLSVTNIGEYLTNVEVEVRVYVGDKVSDLPVDPTYILERDTTTFGETAPSTEFNLSPFAREGITYDGFNGSYGSNFCTWVNFVYSVDYLDAFSLPQSATGNVTILATDGYSGYQDGDSYQILPWNFKTQSLNVLESSIFPITFVDTRVSGSSAVQISQVDWVDSEGNSGSLSFGAAGSNTSNVFRVLNLQIQDGAKWVDITPDHVDAPTLRLQVVCKNKYEAILIGYVDSNGSISYLTFFGKYEESYNYSRDSHRIYRGSNRNSTQGQFKTFSANGRKRITTNSDFVQEDFIEALNELMLTEFSFIAKLDQVRGIDFFTRASENGATIEAKACILSALVNSGLNIDDTRGFPTTTQTQSRSVIVESQNLQIQQKKDNLVNYQIEMVDAFNSIHTFR